MDWHGTIVRRPEVLSGEPTIAGTRLAVEQILQCLADGDTERDLLESYPTLRPDHIKAALAYAAASLAADEVIFTVAP